MPPVSQTDTLTLAPQAPVLSGVFRVDQQLTDWIQLRRTPFSDGIARWLKLLGDGRYTGPPLLLLLGYGIFAHVPLATRAATLSIVSFLVTGGVVSLLQFLFHRHRPCTGASPDRFDGPRYSKHHCFPSGHASVSFAVLAVLAECFAAWPIVAVIAYGLAALTALSRLNDHAHWPSDVIAGMLIAWAVSTALVVFWPPF